MMMTSRLPVRYRTIGLGPQERRCYCETLQVCNCLPYAVEVFYKLSIDANGRCGEIEPGATLSLPCEVVYTEPHQILFKPRDGRCISLYIINYIYCSNNNIML